VYALICRGLDGIGRPDQMSLPQLGLALNALTLQRKRLDR